MSNRANLDIMEAMYQRWKSDSSAVDPSWANFFEGFELGYNDGSAEVESVAGASSLLQAKALGAIFQYRHIGHTQANINPLKAPQPNPRLADKKLGLTGDDLDGSVNVGNYQSGGPTLKVKDLLAHLKKTYSGRMGIEYLHIQGTSKRRFLQERLERVQSTPKFGTAKKKLILQKIMNAELLEQFLHKNFVGQKRFSLQGAETLIAALDALVQKAPGMGVGAYVMGMAHRGRLNVLTEILGKQYRYLFKEFGQNYKPDTVWGGGDVKYHLGFSSTADVEGTPVELHLTPNPSHLEAVDPVVQGRTRALQRRLEDTQQRKKVVPILMHGDAAFVGQGIVTETFNLSKLKGYTSGGTIHIVVNNQIGFTTDPDESRSTLYCSDIAKMVEAPILHVNGDDPEAVVFAIELALDYRQTFGEDIVVDMLCYRRWGHNEADEPRFTQPMLYTKIDKHPLISQTYLESLEKEGVLTSEEFNSWKSQRLQNLDDALNKVKVEKETQPPFAPKPNRFEGSIAPTPQPRYDFNAIATGVKLDLLEGLLTRITHIPDGFEANKKIVRQMKEKLEGFAEDKIDWASGELLAYASLLVDGTPVRLSGQDSVRGTFSHRHAAWFDLNDGRRYESLNNLADDQAPFCVHNSSLSEAAVLGFEYGYAIDYPEMLCIWEAQFGDFANGAQIIIDQFLVSGEAKWQLPTGLTMLLPHGYEGQGPEHSSARMERFLQACAGENMEVAYPSTPAQLFHLLRRQMKRAFRKPLVIMSPKSLLRHPECISQRSDFDEDKSFAEFIDDGANLKNVDRVIMCSGKVYYDLAAYRAQKKKEKVAIVRVEQIYPFHSKAFEKMAKTYRKAKWVWCQEEPKNMGAWSHLREPIEEQIGCGKLAYSGREASASPAVGALATHLEQQQKLVEEAFSI